MADATPDWQNFKCFCSSIGDVRAVPARAFFDRLGVEAGLSSVGGKPWADDACLAGLVRAIDDLLQPQAYLCSMGADRRLHGDEIMRMTERAREQVNISSKPACSFTPECSIRANAVPG